MDGEENILGSETPPVVESAATPEVAGPSAAEALREWLTAHVHNSEFSRDTVLYNSIFGAYSNLLSLVS